MIKKLLIAVVIIVVGIQFIPVDRSNPPVTMDVGADEATAMILRRSCYDCHSNETVWPWYSYVAPVSWLISEDVEHAREHVNFSEWDKYDEKRINKIKEDIVEEVGGKAMPLKSYLVMHTQARVSDVDFQIIKNWAEAGEGMMKEEHEDSSEGNE